MISRSFDQSTFFLGNSISSGTPAFVSLRPPPFNPGTILAPGYSTNSVSRGACAAASPLRGGPGSSFMCASGYGALSNPDYVAGKASIEDYLDPAFGRHYAFFVQGDLNGVQRAQAKEDSTPAGSFYCRLPGSLKVVPIIGSDGKQMLADTEGWLYDSGTPTERRSDTRRTGLVLNRRPVYDRGRGPWRPALTLPLSMAPQRLSTEVPRSASGRGHLPGRARGRRLGKGVA